MYVAKIKGGKDRQFTYYKVFKAYRNASGKTIHELIENLGREDLLLAKDPKAIEKIYEKYGGNRAEKDARAASLRAETTLSDLEKPFSQDSFDYSLLHYGHYVIRHLWKNDLELSRKFNYIQKSQRVQYDIDEVACFLTAKKILKPSSVLETFNHQDDYLGDPIDQVPIDSLYDLFSIVKSNRDSLMKWVHKAVSKVTPEDRHALVFYDVTNTFFESSLTDEEKGYPDKDFIDHVKALLEDELIRGRLEPCCFDDDGQINTAALPQWFWEEAADGEYPYLRMRGPSKEHRTDLPLVSIALVIDKYGFPMDFAVYAGNASEYLTMTDNIEALQKKYRIKNGIVVADRGLNSSKNLQMLLKNKLGFLMAQKISNLGERYKKLLLDESKYVLFDPNHPEYGKYQIVSNYRPSSQKNAEPRTMIFTFNQKRYNRDFAILEAWKRVVERKAQLGVTIGKRKTGWQALAKLEGDEKDRKIIGVDQEVYQSKLALCGYAAMVYRNAPEENENVQVSGDKDKNQQEGTKLDAAELAAIYHQLNQIEDCFRVMKSNLGLRPIYMWNTDHIKGNITVCVLALVIVRLIQWKLKQANEKLTIHQICRALNEAQLVCWKDREGQLQVHQAVKGVGVQRDGVAKMTTEEMVRKVLEERNSERPIDKIMRVCGLTPIKGTYGRVELSRCLKAKFASDEDLVSVPVLAQLGQTGA